MALARDPAFQLFTREMDRLPTRIQRVMRRLHETIKLRHDAANWPDLPATEIQEPEPTPEEAPLKLETSEATAKTEDSNSSQADANDPKGLIRPEPILSSEKFWQVWPNLKPRTKEILLDTSDPNDYRRLAFFEWTRMPETNFWQWLTEGPIEIQERQQNEGPPIAA
jgi:hypothetical protein